MAQRTASTRRSEAASTISSQAVVINTGSGLAAYSGSTGTQTVGGGGLTITKIGRAHV